MIEGAVSPKAGIIRPNVKERVDILLVSRKLCESRAQAQALLLAGRVYSGERRIEKPGTQLDVETVLTVRGTAEFVSRGGNKLAHALLDLNLSPRGAVCVDVGASTGGFTDCLLQNGAQKVYSVDVGHGQLADKLRRDERVIVREGVNARYLVAADFDEPIDWVVVDASFIGIEKLASALAQIAAPGATLLALIKPQFQAGREAVRRGKGVISDPLIRQQAIDDAVKNVIAAGFELLGQCDCRVPGPKGNVEHFLAARRSMAQSISSKEPNAQHA
jgi:23S rRNA (cytidine1920-2'-O)/16S rRNA (cytidine1409-2'-O)-methyltransferase